MTELINILIVIGVLFIIAAAIAVTWRLLHRGHPSRWQQISLIALCTVVIAASIGLMVFIWPKPERTLNVAALQKIYHAATSGKAVFFDSMRQQDSNNWNVGTWNKGDSCDFAEGTYHIKSVEQEYYAWCIAEAPRFTNFAYQVQMNILTGDGGGIVFRANGKHGNYYYFHVGQDGSYDLYRFTGKTEREELQSASSASIKTGPGQSNLLCVVADGSHLDLFVNKQPVAEVQDSSYSSGQIGMAADEDQNTTDVAYSNAEVWVL